MMPPQLLETKANKDFKDFFDNKGYVVPFSEKSVNNCEYICRNPNRENTRLYHFAVGHKFKNLPVSPGVIFQRYYDPEQDEMKCHDFQTLQEAYWRDTDFIEELKTWVENIRNLNSHYIHEFDKLQIDKGSRLACFLKDSFRMATMMTFLETKQENGDTRWQKWQEEARQKFASKSYTSEQFDEELKKVYSSHIANKDFQKQYVEFLRNKFVSDKSWKSDFQEAFKELFIDESLNMLLFTEVKDTKGKNWKLNGDYEIMTIKTGMYLSFVGALFFISMFLYKDEAEQLISKISGYKRSNDEMRSKRNIMTYFSKKLSSQDYNSEEKSLIYFRDIIQYLNKYPTEWNKEKDLDNETSDVAEELKKKIEEMEIERLFPTMKKDKDFKDFAIKKLFGRGDCKQENSIYTDIIDKNDEVRAIYEQIKANKFSEKEYENTKNSLKQYALRYVVKTYFNDKLNLRGYQYLTFGDEKQKLEAELNSNKDVEKLKKRLREKLFYTSYGRNQDRFMEMAVRYLAENKCFGIDAEFKMYRFDTTEEQNEHLEHLTKEERDKQKFHDGRLVYYDTYEKYLQRYPENDTPFVIENNAIQVKLDIEEKKDQDSEEKDKDENGNDTKTLVSIQRSLLIYLLQKVLSEKGNIEGSLLNTLRKYYSRYEKKKQEAYLAFENKDKEKRAQMKKFLPRRAVKVQLSEVPLTLSLKGFEQLLQKAEENERRYDKRLECKQATAQSANSPEVLENFMRKNKGKQFKLQFVRKVWNLMYFRDIYKENAKKEGHHKSFHINRDEYNDFCRYMFAMDTIGEYKEKLRLLLQGKGFFDKSKFEEVFNRGKSLDDYYREAKEKFRAWINAQQTKDIGNKYALDNYKLEEKKKIWYINLSDFIEFLEENKSAVKNFPVLGDNSKHLIEHYYACNKKKLHKKLQKNRLEDCLLYEIAIRYLGKEGLDLRTHVQHILTSTYEFQVMNNTDGVICRLSVPFNQIERYVGLVKHREAKARHKLVLSDRLKEYLGKIQEVENEKEDKDKNKEMALILKDFFEKDQLVTLDSLGKIQKHIIVESSKFLSVYMELEKYFVYKDKLTIKNNNRITYEEITSLHSLVEKEDRNAACHFNLPNDLYEKKVKEIERKFINAFIKPGNYENYGSIPPAERGVLDKLLKKYHNNYYKCKTEKGKQREEAENRYFEMKIKGSNRRKKNNSFLV